MLGRVVHAHARVVRGRVCTRGSVRVGTSWCLALQVVGTQVPLRNAYLALPQPFAQGRGETGRHFSLVLLDQQLGGLCHALVLKLGHLRDGERERGGERDRESVFRYWVDEWVVCSVSVEPW